MQLIDRLLSQVENRKLPPRRSTLVVAVSGGVDSMGLLYLLIPLAAKYEWRLIVAHLNHRLRRRAISDEHWVKGVGNRLGLSVITGRVEVRTLARKQKHTIEEAARVARYDFLNRVAKRHRAKTIVVAHTADDQVETVVMNWLRGAGIRGLIGMSEWQPLPLRADRAQGINVWRPLLGIAKTELRQLAKTLHFGYREDKTNRQVVYTRNRIRHQVLPVLRKVNPQIKEVILRNAENLSGLEDLLNDHLAQSKKAVKLRRDKRSISFRLTQFNKLHPYLQNELLLWVITEVRGDRQDYKSVHLTEMHKVIDSKAKLSYKQLPGKLFLIKAYDKISVSRFKLKNL
ncbi:tRNA lysidine(34) synthetase TilS [Patescibacteria group bacterium]|nr:tRNA lysidine(34) synthetase TilS [Patescibacteria group bacterium]